MKNKIIAALLTLIINAGAAVMILFFMLLAMNGFHESDANWGLGAYIGLALLITLIMAIVAVPIVQILIKKKFSSALAVLISIAISSGVGIFAQIVSGVIGIFIADFVRRNY